MSEFEEQLSTACVEDILEELTLDMLESTDDTAVEFGADEFGNPVIVGVIRGKDNLVPFTLEIEADSFKTWCAAMGYHLEKLQ